MPGEQLTVPTDLDVLRIFADGKRQTPANVSAILDRNQQYMAERLRYLTAQGYLRDAPPAEKSGMYEPTSVGRVAIHRIDKYRRQYHDEFDALVHRVANEQSESDDDFNPDLVPLTERENRAILALEALDGLTIPSEFSEHTDLDLTSEEAAATLYALYFFDIAKRHDDMDVYAALDGD